MDQQTILFAFLLTLIAGLSTGIGSLIAFMAKRTNTNFLSLALGLSAGVMIYVSFMEMMPQSVEALSANFGEKKGMLYLILGFFGGIALIALIDFLVPESRNPHEMHRVEEMKDHSRLKQTGIIAAITIAIHNYPRGDRSGGAHLSCHRQQEESLLALFCLGAGRAGGCPDRLPVPVTFLEPGAQRHYPGCCLRCDDLHLAR